MRGKQDLLMAKDSTSAMSNTPVHVEPSKDMHRLIMKAFTCTTSDIEKVQHNGIEVKRIKLDNHILNMIGLAYRSDEKVSWRDVGYRLSQFRRADWTATARKYNLYYVWRD